MVLLDNDDPLARRYAIAAALNFPFPLQRRMLPELAQAIRTDPDSLVRLDAINTISKFIANLDFELQLQYIQALAVAINTDGNRRVRLAAIKVTAHLLSADLDQNLQSQYPSLVLPALTQAIYNFENLLVQECAAAAMINISKNYHQDTWTSDLVGTVRWLLEEHASSRSWLEKLKSPQRWDFILEENISQEDIDRHQARINAIIMLMLHFKKKLPPHTWGSIEESLSRDQVDEFNVIWDLICQRFADLIYQI